MTMAVESIYSLKPLHSIHPGEWYFGADYERIHTVLGSCVALVIWHPKFKIGGLCHYLLASSTKVNSLSSSNCRYAEHALAQMKKSMLSVAPMEEFQISIFGGGDMFSFESPRSIGMDNIAYARQWLVREKIKLHQSDVGGSISRSVVLLTATGEIQLKRYAMSPQQLL
jgi:chemotaxis protein CheD